MSGINFIPSFNFYNLATALASPYTSFAAYRSGAIDQNGNVLTGEQDIDPFEYFVIKLKKIFDQLPYGSTRYKLGNVIGVLELFSEEATKFGVKKEEFNCLVEEHFSYITDNKVSYFNLLEDMSVGGAGGGAAGSLGTPSTGAGINTGSVTGFDPRLGSMMTRDNPVNMLPSIEMFNVSDDDFNQFKQAKAWRHLKDSETKRYLQRFQRRNKDGKMAVRNSNTGEIHWVKYNDKSLIEEFNLFDLDILNEMEDFSNEPGGAVEALNDANDKEESVAVLTDKQEKQKSKRGVEIGKATQRKSRALHSSFASYLQGINLTPYAFPDKETRSDPERLAKFHKAMPHRSFYVSDNPDVGGGHDSFVKINDEVHGGVELKGASLNRHGKFEITPINVGGMREYIPSAISAVGRTDKNQASALQGKIDTFMKKKKGSVSSVFGSGPRPKNLKKLISRRAQRTIAKKGEVLLVGSEESGGFHVLTTALRDQIPIYDADGNQSGTAIDAEHKRQLELIKAIGLDTTGKLSDWGNPITPRWTRGSLKSRFEINVPQAGVHGQREAYERNRKIQQQKVITPG